MRTRYYRRLGLFSFMMLFYLFAGCTRLPPLESETTLEPISLRLGWQHSVQYLGLYVAESRGYYAEEGLEVTLHPSTDSDDMDAMVKLVENGTYDFGLGGLATILPHMDDPLVVVAAFYQYAPVAFFARADSGIVTPSDFAGRRVVVKSEAWESLLVDILEHEGLTMDDIEAIPGGFDMTPFYEGEVDVWAGWITNEVVLARQNGLDLVTIPLSEYGIHNKSNMLYTSQGLLTSNPELVEKFLWGSIRGWQWAMEHPEEATDIFIERFPETAAEREFNLASFLASIPLIHPGGTNIGTIECSADYFRGNELPEGFCTTEILETVWERK